MNSEFSKSLQAFAKHLETYSTKGIANIVLAAMHEADASKDDAICATSLCLYADFMVRSNEWDAVIAYNMVQYQDDVMTVLTDVFPDLDSAFTRTYESKNTMKYNKKLYENIMKDVSKIVKSHLK